MTMAWAHDSKGRAVKWVSLSMFIAMVFIITSCTKQEEAEVLHMDNYLQSYSNPFSSLEGEWDDYGNGDPYVLRYNGQYYLYVSTKDHRVGIKAWRSNNLIDWSYVGLVADDADSTGAYAPEVTYWNGKFYLYTSPAGNGHYVYESDSPEGPFKRVTENLGMSIDGSVFIDDDGSWYLTHAGTTGIVGVPMSSPTEFGNGKVIEGAFLGHWTEGSMIIKRNGLYYMTLTGNHVFSRGYRINYGVSDQSPLGPYIMPDHNPIAINTEGDFYGLGHSSTVLGPDMDSYYLVYHNLLGSSAEGPPVRAMNIDRLVFNGRKMDLLGPSNFQQPQPRMPQLYAHLNESVDAEQWIANEQGHEGSLISRLSSAAYFTAEYNFSIQADEGEGKLQLIFNYRDEQNYYAVVVHPHDEGLTVISVQDGIVKELGAAELLPGMNLAALHTVRIAQHERGLDLYWDGLQQLSIPADRLEQLDATDKKEKNSATQLAGGAIGYRYENLKASFYYTAFSNSAAGSSDYDVLKPIPGTIEAVHYLQGEKQGYYMHEASEEASIRIADGVHIEETEQGEHAVLLQHKGDWLRYGVNVAADGDYLIAMTIDSVVSEHAELDIIVDDQEKTSYKLSVDEAQAAASQDNGAAPWSRVTVGTISLPKGYHTITVRAVKGKLLWSNMDFHSVSKDDFSIDGVLEQSTAEDMHGEWQLNDSWYSGSHDQQDAKLYGGQTNWSDYRIDTTVRLGDNASGNAGVLFRVRNESDFPHQVTDALIGYYVAVTSTKIELYRLNYDSVMLHAEKLKLPLNEEVKLSVEAIGERITVYIDDQKLFSYLDASPMLVGKVGLRSQYAREIEFTDLSVKAVTNKK